MHKVTYTSSRLCGGLVTRLTGRREYVHVDTLFKIKLKIGIFLLFSD